MMFLVNDIFFIKIKVNLQLYRVIIIKVSKHKKKEPLIGMMSNLNGILLKAGENVWHKEKKVPNFSNK